MIDLIAELCGVMAADLEPTAAYAARRIVWRLGDKGHDDGRLGTLVVTVRPRGRRAVEEDTYAVEEVPLLGRMGRQFLLLNVSDPEQADVYEVTVGPAVASCTCKAGQCKQSESCKHRCALRYLLANGGLPPAPAGDPDPLPAWRRSDPCPF